MLNRNFRLSSPGSVRRRISTTRPFHRGHIWYLAGGQTVLGRRRQKLPRRPCRRATPGGFAGGVIKLSYADVPPSPHSRSSWWKVYQDEPLAELGTTRGKRRAHV